MQSGFRIPILSSITERAPFSLYFTGSAPERIVLPPDGLSLLIDHLHRRRQGVGDEIPHAIPAPPRHRRVAAWKKQELLVIMPFDSEQFVTQPRIQELPSAYLLRRAPAQSVVCKTA